MRLFAGTREQMGKNLLKVKGDENKRAGMKPGGFFLVWWTPSNFKYSKQRSRE